MNPNLHSLHAPFNFEKKKKNQRNKEIALSKDWNFEASKSMARMRTIVGLPLIHMYHLPFPRFPHDWPVSMFAHKNVPYFEIMNFSL